MEISTVTRNFVRNIVDSDYSHMLIIYHVKNREFIVKLL